MYVLGRFGANEILWGGLTSSRMTLQCTKLAYGEM
jgi:hypothetical protein